MMHSQSRGGGRPLCRRCCVGCIRCWCCSFVWAPCQFDPDLRFGGIKDCLPTRWRWRYCRPLLLLMVVGFVLCLGQRYYPPLLDPCYTLPDHQQNLSNFVADMCSELDRMNVTYWLDYGTALGAWRMADVLPWDHDSDISILADTNASQPEFRRLMHSALHRVKRAGGYPQSVTIDLMINTLHPDNLLRRADQHLLPQWYPTSPFFHLFAKYKIFLYFGWYAGGWRGGRRWCRRIWLCRRDRAHLVEANAIAPVIRSGSPSTDTPRAGT